MDSLKQQWRSKDAPVEYQVHLIHLGDCDDPDLFVAQPIYEWQQTEKGKYIMEHSKPEPMWVRCINHRTYGYDYKIKAYLTPAQLTYYRLKFE
jgi:hypothetical protein